MMRTPEHYSKPPSSESIRSPEVAQRAASLIEAVETATEGQIPSIDKLMPGESLIKKANEHLAQADAFYDRHAAIFFNPNEPHTQQPTVDLDAAIALCNEVNKEVKQF